MNYQSAIAYLEFLQSTNIELGLSRMDAACEALSHPEKTFPSVIVAGTNGKGSTCAFLESLFRHSGLKAGLYTSPHLVSVRERIQINRRMISEPEFAGVAETVINKLRKSGGRLTYFEFLTAVAFQYFAREKVDIAVLEVGLGGRFDATNVATPAVSVITRVGMDHQKYLGDTIEKIVFEKSGIIKDGVPVVTIDQAPEAMAVIRKVAEEKKAMLYVVSPVEVRWPLGLLGKHQLENAACAVRAAEIAWDGIGGDVARALLETRWPGRLEVISEKPLVILDGAHNVDGAEALAGFLKDNYSGRRKIILFGVMADKDVCGMIDALAPVADEWVASRPDTPRALAAKELTDLIRARSQRPVKTREPLSIAVEETTRTMPANAVLIITGSLYTVGEVKMRAWPSVSSATC